MQLVVISFAAKRKLVPYHGARSLRNPHTGPIKADTLYGDGGLAVRTGIGVWERHQEGGVPAWVERVRAPSLGQ
jgi:hypothetical protein